MNKAILIGNVGQDPVLKESNGAKFCHFSVATTRKYKNNDGVLVEKTQWHKITTMQKMAENCARFLKKGSKVAIEGEIQYRKYTNDQNQDVYVTNVFAERIEFLSSPKEKTSEQSSTESDDLNSVADDIPF